MSNKEWFCVVCAKHKTDKEIFTDLGHFNDAICKECEDTPEAKEELGV